MDDKDDEGQQQPHPQYNDQTTTMVAISISVLSCIFISAFCLLIIICRRERKRKAVWNRFDNK